MDGQEFLELPEDKLYDLPDLFIGIEDHLSREVPGVAGGDIEAEFTPACLGELAVLEALLYDV